MEWKLIRGDTEIIKLRFLNSDKKEFKPNFIENGDLFTFTVRDRQKNGDVVLQKTIEYPNVSFNISHIDTKDLEIGKYDYDIEFRKTDYSIVKTFIVGRLTIVKDVTYEVN